MAEMTNRNINLSERIELRKLLNSRKNIFIKISGLIHLIENQSNSLYKNNDGIWTVKTLPGGKFTGYKGHIDALHVLINLRKEFKNEKK